MADKPLTDLGDPAVQARGGPQADPPETPTGLWVRATVHLPGLPRGKLAYVNPADPEVQRALTKPDPPKAPHLVPLPGQDFNEQIFTDNVATTLGGGANTDTK